MQSEGFFSHPYRTTCRLNAALEAACGYTRTKVYSTVTPMQSHCRGSVLSVVDLSVPRRSVRQGRKLPRVFPDHAFNTIPV
jgi:hypothetical protein